MLAEDSSSANVKQFILSFIDILPSGIVYLKNEDGSEYFSRECYFDSDSFASINANLGSPISEACLDSLLFALECFKIEGVSLNYLNRAEHCRKQLCIKLQKKGFDSVATERVLDYLVERDFLNDKRFAEAWLALRTKRKHEGRIRLCAELVSRGVSRSIADEVLDEHFETVSEQDICEKAVIQVVGQGKSKEKVFSSLMRRGFSYTAVQAALESCGVERNVL